MRTPHYSERHFLLLWGWCLANVSHWHLARLSRIPEGQQAISLWCTPKSEGSKTGSPVLKTWWESEERVSKRNFVFSNAQRKKTFLINDKATGKGYAVNERLFWELEPFYERLNESCQLTLPGKECYVRCACFNALSSSESLEELHSNASIRLPETGERSLSLWNPIWRTLITYREGKVSLLRAQRKRKNLKERSFV